MPSITDLLDEAESGGSPAATPEAPTATVHPVASAGGTGSITDLLDQAENPADMDLPIALHQAAKTAPDLAASVLSASRESGLGTAVTSRNLPAVREAVERDRLDPVAITASAPISAKWMGEDPFHAAAAKDSLEQIQRIESLTRRPAYLRPLAPDQMEAEAGRQADLMFGQYAKMKAARAALPAGLMGAAQRVESRMAGPPQPDTSDPYAGMTDEQARAAMKADALRMIQREEEFIGGTDQVGFFEKWKVDFQRNPLLLLPFLSQLMPIQQALEERGLKTAAEPTGLQQSRLYRLERLKAVENLRGTSIGGGVASILDALPAFMGEIAMTGGVYGAVKTGTQGVKIVAAAERAIESGILRLAKNPKLAASLLPAKTMVSGAIASAPQAMVGGAGRVAATALQRATPEGYFDEASGMVAYKIKPGTGEPFSAAIPKAIVDQYTEYASERTGGIFRFLDEPLGKFLFGWWAAKNPGKTAAAFQRFLKKSAFHGVLGEMGEERVGDLMKAVGGVQSWGQAVPTPGQLASEFLGFLVPGAAGTALGRATAPKTSQSVMVYDAIQKDYEESPLTQRVPDVAAELLARQVEDTAHEHIHIPAPEYMRLMQEANLDPEEAARDLGAQESLKSAREFGTGNPGAPDVEIPIARWMRKFAGTPVAKSARKHIRWGGEETLAESERFAQEAVEGVEKKRVEAEGRLDRALDAYGQQFAAAGQAPEQVKAAQDLLRGLVRSRNAAMRTSAYETLAQFGLTATGPAEKPAREARVQPWARDVERERWEKATQAERARMTYISPVTGTYNARAWEEAEVPPGKTMVAEVEPPAMKHANEMTMRGHDAGDDLLRYSAAALQAQVPDLHFVDGKFLFHVENEAEKDRILAAANAAMPKTLILGGEAVEGAAYRLTGAVGQGPREAGQAHRAWKEAEVKAGRRAARGEAPAGYAKAQAEGAAPSAVLSREIGPGYAKRLAGAEPGAAQQRASMSRFPYIFNHDAYLRLRDSYQAKASMDLNQFNRINEEYGREAGDEALRHISYMMSEIAQQMSDLHGAEIVLFHKSGDEFLALCDGPAQLHDFYEQVAEELRYHLCRTKDKNGNEIKIPLSFSVGIGGSDESAERHQRMAKTQAGFRLAAQGEGGGPLRPVEVEKPVRPDARGGEGDRLEERGGGGLPYRDSVVSSGFDTGGDIRGQAEGARKRLDTLKRDIWAKSPVNVLNNKVGYKLLIKLPEAGKALSPQEYQHAKDMAARFRATGIKVTHDAKDPAARGVTEYGEAIQQLYDEGEIHGHRLLSDTSQQGSADTGLVAGPHAIGDWTELEEFIRDFAGRTRADYFEDPTPAKLGEYAGEYQGLTQSLRQEPAAPVKTDTPEFKRWFGDSKVVDEQGIPKVVYHGTKRPDRVGTRFLKKRATSGPMPFFTDDKELSSSYSTNKKDTSVENISYDDWYMLKPKGSVREINIIQAWYYLTPEQKAKVIVTGPHITKNDNDEIIYDPDAENGIGAWDISLQEARGNGLRAHVAQWLESGDLFDDEERFAEVLKLAGIEGSRFNSPWQENPGVFPVYLSIKKPLITQEIPTEVLTALEKASSRQRKPPDQYGADTWDKRTRDPVEWVRQLKEDVAKSENSHVWTSIPDFITKTLAELGYDGIIDKSGKYGGEEHTVYVPFEPTQIKSAIGNRGTFDPNNPNILFQSPVGEPGRDPTKDPWQDPRGETVFTGGAARIILGAKADASTLPHELMHAWVNRVVAADYEALRAMPEDALSPLQKRYLGDCDTILKWVGAKSFRRLSYDQQESLARAFEQYLAEGRAPSNSLRRAFNSYKEWILRIYKELKAAYFGAPTGRTIDDRMRRAFGNLLSVGEEVEAAEDQLTGQVGPLFVDPLAAGMPEKDASQYNDLVNAGRMEAAEEMAKREAAREAERNSPRWKKTRAEFEKEALEETDRVPVYAAINAIRKNGTLLDPAFVPADLADQMPAGTVAEKDGQHPDVVADAFRFPSGAEMIRQMAQAPPQEVVVADLVNQRLVEADPDLFGETLRVKAAMDAIQRNTAVSQRLWMDLRHLASANLTTRGAALKAAPVVPAEPEAPKKWTPRPEGAAEEAAPELPGTPPAVPPAPGPLRMPSEARVADLVRAHVGRLVIRRLNPGLYVKNQAYCAREAARLLAVHDVRGAFYATYAQLLNHEYYRACLEAQDRYEEGQRLFNQFRGSDKTLTQSRDIAHLNAGRAVLAEYEFGPATEMTAADYLKPIKDNDPDPEVYNHLSALVGDITAVAKPWKKLTVDEFDDLAMAVGALWEKSRAVRQMEIRGQKVEMGKVTQDLAYALEAYYGVTGKDRTTAPTEAMRRRTSLLGLKARFGRMENWADKVDLGEYGIATRLVRELKDACARLRVDEGKYGRELFEVFKDLGEMFQQRVIEAPELPGRDGGIHVFNSVGEIFMTILNMGNKSNTQKTLRGWGWCQYGEDGNLDTSNWQSFIQRMWAEGVITEAHYKAAQAVWDIFEKLKPLSQRAHKAEYGYYFNDITAEPVETPWGTFRGGYLPVDYDRFADAAAEARAERSEVEGQNNSFRFPTAGSGGFTKRRIEAYAAPVSLDPRGIWMALGHHLQFIHVVPRAREISRLFWQKGFRAQLDRYDPGLVSDMVIPWLTRAAHQRIEESSTGKGGRLVDSWARWLRSATGAQIMFYHFINTLQNLTNVSTVLKTGGRRIPGALFNYMRHPRETTEEIASRSVFMADRLGRDMQKVAMRLGNLMDPGVLKNARRWTSANLYAMQEVTQNLMDIVCWSAAYDKAMDETHGDEAESVSRADAAVRMTQGAFNPEDLSTMETGNAFVRMFTMFTGYFNTQLTLLESEGMKAVKQGQWGRLFLVGLFGITVPAMLNDLMYDFFAGRPFDRDDDGYLDDFLTMFFFSQLRWVGAMVPVVGPTAVRLTEKVVARLGVPVDTFGFDNRVALSPVGNFLETAAKTPEDLINLVQGNGNPKAAVRDTLTLLGLATKLPLAPLAKPFGYAYDVATGEKTPRGSDTEVLGVTIPGQLIQGADYLRGLATGR